MIRQSFCYCFLPTWNYESCSRRKNENCSFRACYGRRINPENLVFQVIFEASATASGVNRETFPWEQFRLCGNEIHNSRKNVCLWGCRYRTKSRVIRFVKRRPKSAYFARVLHTSITNSSHRWTRSKIPEGVRSSFLRRKGVNFSWQGGGG